jgi:uncharacterized membrane protein YfcA
MTLAEVAALFAAGVAAGTINTIAGSGTLISFPALLAFGYSPVVANVTNTVAFMAGSVSGIHGYRREIGEFRATGDPARLRRLVAASFLGAASGAVLLIALPADAFQAIVPVLIVTALVLVVLQPKLAARLAARRSGSAPGEGPTSDEPRRSMGRLSLFAVAGSAVYGGYFGAAQGVLLMAILGIACADRLPVLNGVKNVLVTSVNGVASVVFVVAGAFGHSGAGHPSVVWGAAATIAAGGIVGGQVGARIGRRLSPTALRGLIVMVGTLAVIRLLA